MAHTDLSDAYALAMAAMTDVRSIATSLQGFTTPIALERADDAAERAIRSLNQLRLMVRTMRRNAQMEDLIAARNLERQP